MRNGGINMNKTQRIIILTGDKNIVQEAIKVIKGFKAISIVKELSTAVVENVFRHNKNVLYVAENMELDLIIKFRPIVLNCVEGESKAKNLQLGTKNILEDFPKILDSYDIDVGDHVFFDSTATDPEEIKKNCFLCKVVEGKPDKPEHILYESDNFIVIPGLGAFFDGYVMIVPKKHIMSFAELSKEEYQEFLRVLNDIRFILKSVYKKEIFVFECGSGRDGGGKHTTSIVHAHIHLAPTDMPVLDEIHKSGLYPAQIEPLDLISNFGQYPYMLYIDQKDNWYITSDPNTYFPRQHPRQVLADYMGLEKGQYNWRNYPMREKLDIIAEEIYSFCRKEFDNLPRWIQEAVTKYL